MQSLASFLASFPCPAVSSMSWQQKVGRHTEATRTGACLCRCRFDKCLFRQQNHSTANSGAVSANGSACLPLPISVQPLQCSGPAPKPMPFRLRTHSAVRGRLTRKTATLHGSVSVLGALYSTCNRKRFMEPRFERAKFKVNPISKGRPGGFGLCL